MTIRGKGHAFQVFEDYHLRVGEVTSDTAPPASRLKAESGAFR